MATQPTDSKYRLRSNASDELAVIAQRAQAFTNASGAAIALSEGNAEEIVCRARSGSSAPDVGVTLRVEGSFTGLCIQSGKELRCDDAETDTRVDTAAIRSLGIRSMVVTPVKDENKVVGVLAVFAPTPHAFTITHVAVLKTMADQISALLLKERRARDEGLHNEPVVTAPRPPASVAPPSPPPQPVVIKSNGSNGSNSSSAAVAMAPARSAATAPKIEVIKAPAPVETPAPAPVPFPKREERRVEHAPEPVARASFGTFDAVAGEQKEPGNKKFMVVGVVVVLAVVAVGSWFALRKGNSPAPQPAPVTTAAATPAPSPAASGTASAPVATSTAAPAAQPAAPAPVNTKPAAAETKPESKKPEPAKQDSKPAAQPSPATVAVTGGSSRISTAAAQQQQTTEAVSSNLAVGGGSSSALSSLARPTSSATPAMMAQSELVPVQLLHSVPAVYPAIAKARRLSGTAVVRVSVGKDGKVSNPRFVSGPPVFKDAAFEAVTQWRYKPATLNGQPVEQEQEIKINFKPQ